MDFSSILDMFCQRYDQRNIQRKRHSGPDLFMKPDTRPETVLASQLFVLRNFSQNHETSSISDKFVELMTFVLSSAIPEISSEVSVSTIKKVLENPLSDFLESFVTEFTSDEACLFGLKWLRKQIWGEESSIHTIQGNVADSKV